MWALPFLLWMASSSSYSTATMLRYLAMLITCLFVGGAMALILVRFLRRLRKIEEDKWGKKL